ncbi:hypothetical protein COLO4_27645 [Corchorus olitorius]|uniref:PH domain-containing protein n=1 Tax=Corchorus olitorius TaxID=93759 RepID=A0A1R3HQ20_9ROSI|nr:hypothetical protein COLO4_27645 [Corchorus olitorius]
MAAFIKLEDSPMFQKQICSLEYTADELKDRCQKLYKGSKKFMTALGESYNGDVSFADSLEAFGGGQDDPISVSIGGPIMSKFLNAFRELASYKELLRSQESRRRFDKAISAYDQAREKFVSLKKNTRGDIVAELEEDLQNSKSAFERSRFTLVLTYAQQSKELANAEHDRLEKRIQEFRTQSEIDSLRASSNLEPTTTADRILGIGMNSDKNIEAIMQSSTNGEVQTIKQGYLLKRSSNLRGDWKRRFFVLDSQGTLYYYRNKGTKPTSAALLNLIGLLLILAYCYALSAQAFIGILVFTFQR